MPRPGGALQRLVDKVRHAGGELIDERTEEELQRLAAQGVAEIPVPQIQLVEVLVPMKLALIAYFPEEGGAWFMDEKERPVLLRDNGYTVIVDNLDDFCGGLDEGPCPPPTKPH